MNFKVSTEGSSVFRSKVLFCSSGIIFRDNNGNYIKVHFLFERVAPIGSKYTPSMLCSKNSFSEAFLKETNVMQGNY